MKKCRRCGLEKKETAFKKDKRQPDGRTVTCRHCYENNKLLDRNQDPIQKLNQSRAQRGKKHSLEWRLAISSGQRKAVNEGRHHWKKNDSRHKDQDRCSIYYKMWREKVLERAKGKCEKCGNDKRLHVHHIKCFYEFPDLRFDETNGQVLCQSCHSTLHKIRDKTGRKKRLK